MLENLRDLLSKEPVIIIGMVQALIGLLAAFGLVLTGFQIAAIIAFVGALIVLLSALLAERPLVSPSDRAKQFAKKREKPEPKSPRRKTTKVRSDPSGDKIAGRSKDERRATA